MNIKVIATQHGTSSQLKTLLDLLDNYDVEAAAYFLKKRPYKLLSIVVISLGIHLLLIYALMQNHNFKAIKKDDRLTDHPEPIQAKLMFVPIENLIEPPKAIEKLSDIVEKEPITPEMPAVEEPPLMAEEPALVAPDEAETPPPEEAQPPQKTIEKTYPAIDYSNAPDVAKQQLRGLNQTKLETLAQQAAREYREQQDSPQLELKPSDPFVTEDEKLRESVEVKVNCDGYTNTAATMVSGLFGGTLKCTKSPEIDSFIQNRLNKTELQSPTKKR